MSENPWRKISNWPGRVKAFKYVDSKFAKEVAAGALRIGTLRDYDALPNKERSDPNEGRVEFTLNKAFGAFDEDLHEKMVLRKLGLMDIQAEHISFQGIGFRASIENIYCLCLTLKHPNSHLWAQGPQTVFQIRDLKSFAAAVSRQDPRLSSRMVGQVIYRSGIFEPFAADAMMPSPFTKDQQFSAEEEVRIVWKMDNQDGRPFNLKPSLDVFRCMRPAG